MFEIRVAGDGQVIVSGRLYAAQTQRVREVFQGLSSPTTVDCAGLEYIATAGVTELLDLYKRLSAAGHSLRLVNVTPPVRTVLTYLGFDKLFGIT